MKPKHDVPTAPSFYLESAINGMKLDGTIDAERLKRLAKKADAFQARHCPGRSCITMAAFVADALPIRVSKWGNFVVRRTNREIAEAFGCSESSMRERRTLIKTERD